MKKILYLMCIVFLCCTIFATSVVSAAEITGVKEIAATEIYTTAPIYTSPEPTIAGYGGEYEEIFVKRLELYWTENGWSDEYTYEELFYYHGDDTVDIDEATPKYVLVKAACPLSRPIDVFERIGEYMVHSPSDYIPYSLAYYIYVPSEDKIYTIEEAYYADIERIDYAFTNSGIDAVLIGDSDGNGTLNVKDATMIQKHLAGLEVEWGVSGSRLDFVQDDVLNIKDATAIQKHIAGLEY